MLFKKAVRDIEKPGFRLNRSRFLLESPIDDESRPPTGNAFEGVLSLPGETE